MYEFISRENSREKAIRDEIECLQNQQRIFWTLRRSERINELWRELNSSRKK